MPDVQFNETLNLISIDRKLLDLIVSCLRFPWLDENWTLAIETYVGDKSLTHKRNFSF